MPPPLLTPLSITALIKICFSVFRKTTGLIPSTSETASAESGPGEPSLTVQAHPPVGAAGVAAATIAGSTDRGSRADEAASAAAPRAASGLREPDAAAGSRDDPAEHSAPEALAAPKEAGESTKQRLSTTQRRQQALAKSSRQGAVEAAARLDEA